MRELIDAFFRERSIVNHHIASFNDFLPTIDNPNSRMQRIVDNLRSSPEDERRGIIKLDEDRTEGDVIEIRIGRKRDDRAGLTSRRNRRSRWACPSSRRRTAPPTPSIRWRRGCGT